jgi:hypothetical protein
LKIRAFIRKIEEPINGKDNSRIKLKKRTYIENVEEFWEYTHGQLR